MKNLLLVILVFILSLGCRTQKLSQSTETSSTKVDSSSHEKEVIIKDTIIYIKGDSVLVNIPCDVDTAYILNTAKSQVSVVVNKGKVTTTLLTKDQSILITKLQEKVKEYQLQKTDTVYTESKIIEVPVKYIPWIYRYSAYLGWILGGIGAIYLIIKLK
tara:strand:+ start:713 stop:1189 length:477 start_codon:yes stop_codon:yes gene_type:complete